MPLLAIAGPVLFTLGWFTLGFVSPGFSVGGDWIAPYSAVSHPISGLGMGDTAIYMNSAFILGGLLLLVGVIGVFRTVDTLDRPGRWVYAALLGLSPLGLVIAGIFDLDHEIGHFVGFGLVVSPVFTFALAGRFFRGIPEWRRFGTWLILGSPLTLLLLVLYLLSFDETATSNNDGVAGITSRLLGLGIHAWFVAMGWLAFTHDRRSVSADRTYRGSTASS